MIHMIEIHRPSGKLMSYVRLYSGSNVRYNYIGGVINSAEG